MKKLFSFLVFLYLLFQVSPLDIHAAGTFNCKPVKVGFSSFGCDVDTSTCTAVEHNNCTSYTYPNCPTTQTACLAGAPAAAPGAPGAASANPATCNGGNGINTAIGCIPIFAPSGMKDLMTFILAWGSGIAGGIAFLLILYSGFQIMTSSGNPQKLQAGKELLGAAVSGLLLLIFSAFILRVVGVDILKIFV